MTLLLHAWCRASQSVFVYYDVFFMYESEIIEYNEDTFFFLFVSFFFRLSWCSPDHCWMSLGVDQKERRDAKPVCGGGGKWLRNNYHIIMYDFLLWNTLDSSHDLLPSRWKFVLLSTPLFPSHCVFVFSLSQSQASNSISLQLKSVWGICVCLSVCLGYLPSYVYLPRLFRHFPLSSS